jgi:hypothetical protein
MFCTNLTIACLLLAAGSARGQLVRDALPAPDVRVPAEGVRVPLNLYGGRPVVEVRVNGRGPYRFYFDTGASGPVLGERLARELNLPQVGQAAVKSGGDAPGKNPIAARLVRLDNLELGAVRLAAVTVVAMDHGRLGGADAPLGVLSPALFRGLLVTLDFSNKELRVRPGELGTPDDKTIFGYRAGLPIPSVRVTVGDLAVEAHLDSGSPAGLSLPTSFAEKLPLATKPIDTGKKARSVTGEFPVLEAKLNGRLAFGQFSFVNPTIEFSDVVQHGNIGARILKQFIITLDAKNRRFEMIEVG